MGGRLSTCIKWAVCFFVALLCAAPASRGQVFVTNFSSGTVAEYSTTGTLINGSLISGLSYPDAIAVSGSYLYVANDGNGTIGKYTTAGATVNAALVSGLVNPSGIAVSGTNLYVDDYYTGTLGSYTTSGSRINASLATGLYHPEGIAASATDVYVIAAGDVADYTTTGTLKTAALGGGAAVQNGFGLGLSGSDLFVVDTNPNTVVELTTSGTVVNPALVSGLYNAFGLAVGDGDLYITSNANPSYVGEYTTAGGTVSPKLFTTASIPYGVAVIPSVPEPASFGLTFVAAAAVACQRRRRRSNG